MNVDKSAFLKGYQSKLKEAGFGDTMWNSTLGLFGKHGYGTPHITAGASGLRDNLWHGATDAAGKFMNESVAKAMSNGLDKTLNQAGQNLGAGALNGAVNAGKTQVSNMWDGVTKTFKNYGNGLMNDPMQTIKDNPWLSGGLAAGGLGLGYMGGKMMGLWGGDDKPANGSSNTSMQSNGGQQGNPPPMMQSAYTPGYTPMALQKSSSEFPIGIPSPMASILNPSISVGSSIYNVLNTPTPESAKATPQQMVVNPGNARVKKLLRNPKMRAYITGLLQQP